MGGKDIPEVRGMYDDVPKYVIALSKDLRKNATRAESILWEYLRDGRLMNYKFRRQHPIGRYITDFYCNKASLIIEVDGDIHKNVNVKEYDEIRQKELESKGFNILRFTNEEILLDIDNVINVIKHTLYNSPLL